MKQPYEFKIMCRFGNHQIGTQTIDLAKPPKALRDIDPDDFTNELLGIEDARCDVCTATHGNYPEMAKAWYDAGGSHQGFLKHMKKEHFKNTNFDKELTKLREKK